MKRRLRVIEIRKDRPIELPDDSVPLKLERVVESSVVINPPPSPDRFMLYYLEKAT